MIVREQTPLPQYVQIEPVGQCNLRCRMCPIQFRDVPGGAPAFMSFDTFRELMDQFPELTELHLQGMGEPLMHPRFFDMVRYAARRGVTVTTNSNLTLVSERRAEECVTSGLRRLHVSLDGASAQTYEYIRVRARHARVLRNLARVVAAKRRAASALPEIELVMVVMRRNLHELPELVRVAHEQGAQGLSVQHLCHDFSEASLPARYRPMREFVDAETLLHEPAGRVASAFAQAERLAQELQMPLRLPRLAPRPHEASVRGRARCDWPWRGAYVSYGGEAMPCCMVATPDRINFGNMAQAGVAPVWNNADYESFREQLASDTPPAVCRGCALYNGTF
jgi:MoaA/NifB/PqqE/SkfB family radical SAM enzyme